jgi:hypothetical protein
MKDFTSLPLKTVAAARGQPEGFFFFNQLQAAKNGTWNAGIAEATCSCVGS